MNYLIPTQKNSVWTVIDQGLRLNAQDGDDFYAAGEVMIGHACLEGKNVFVKRLSGRFGFPSLGPVVSIHIDGEEPQRYLTDKEAKSFLRDRFGVSL